MPKPYKFEEHGVLLWCRREGRGRERRKEAQAERQGDGYGYWFLLSSALLRCCDRNACTLPTVQHTLVVVFEIKYACENILVHLCDSVMVPIGASIDVCVYCQICKRSTHPALQEIEMRGIQPTAQHTRRCVVLEIKSCYNLLSVHIGICVWIDAVQKRSDWGRPVKCGKSTHTTPQGVGFGPDRVSA